MTPNSQRLRADTAWHMLRKCLSEKTGVAAIEFAILAPLLFLILIGILVYGLYFGTVHAVQQLAADSARASIAGLTDAERTTLVGDLDIDVNVLGLGLGLPGAISSAASTGLASTMPALDSLVSGLLEALGITLGEADVRLHDIRCDGSVLVG